MRKRLVKDAHLKRSLYTQNKILSLVITPWSFVDPTFAIIGTGIVGIALLEKGLGMRGNVMIAGSISKLLKIALPIVAVVSIVYFIRILGTIGGF